MSSERVVFVESAAQARTLAGRRSASTTSVVALTGPAIVALDELGVPHVPVSSFARPVLSLDAERRFVLDLAAILREIEAHLVARDASAARAEGFLVDQTYHAYFSVASVSIRALLIRDTVRALHSRVVSVFPGAIEPWFEGDGYTEAPWVAAVDAFAGGEGFELERLVAADPTATVARPSRRLLQIRAKAAFRRRHLPFGRSAAGGLRLLFLRPPLYDWSPVARRLVRSGGADSHWLDNVRLEPPESWRFALGNLVTDVRSGESRPVGVAFAHDVNHETRLAALFDEWLRTRREHPRLLVDGVDVFPALIPTFRAMTALSPAIAAHGDAIADAALDAVEPHAVCAFSIPWLSGKRLARRAQARNTPVVCYQHGGAYGTHRLVVHELMDWAYGDYFLSYGDGIRPPDSPTFPLRAQFVPVGSAAIAADRPRAKQARRRRTTRVLWLAEFETRNAYTYHMGDDTVRHLVERRGLEILSRARGLHVTFRPYPAQAATSDVLRALQLVDVPVHVDTDTPVYDCVRRSDLVVTDNHSGTVWNQVLAWDRPLLIFCDPREMHFDPTFADDLDAACLWCKDADSFVLALERLAGEPATFVNEARRRDTDRFLERYVLHRGDPALRTTAFLESLREAADP